ncbi:MAG: hypothetical protein J7J76_09425 [Candidatus Latescibacteria bacterium]|nr:hypothetical protein [Candidatus Latescibacterota bacterium]
MCKRYIWGTGEGFDWEIAKRAKRYGRITLAWGLNPGNMRAAVSQVSPYVVDIGSGVQIRHGKKERRKLEQLVLQVRNSTGGRVGSFS